MTNEFKTEVNSDIENFYQVGYVGILNINNKTLFSNNTYIDQKINEEIELICKSRFFPKFDINIASIRIYYSLTKGDLSIGSDEVKCRALAWCARLLSIDRPEIAEEIIKNIKNIKNIESSLEIIIAEAFIHSYKKEKTKALSILADIDSPLTRTASLMIVAKLEGPKSAIEWMELTGITGSSLDSDGKYFLMNLYIQLNNWEILSSCLGIITDEDFSKTPALYITTALTYLISTVPNEYRPLVVQGIPINMADVPFAADEKSISARRQACNFFNKGSEAAQRLNFSYSAKLCDKYALWLELSDPYESDKGKQRLKDNLQYLKSALGFVSFACQYKIDLDLEEVEKEIERQKALYGELPYDAGDAALALALIKKNPDYIPKYHDELIKYYDKKVLYFFQIEMLSKLGMIEKTEEYLNILTKIDLNEAEKIFLQSIVNKAEKTISIEEDLKKQFTKTGFLSDLIILVNQLETKYEWEELCEYSEILFNKTYSLQDAERFVNALNNTQKYDRIVEFLEKNSNLLTQSNYLQIIYCDSLYNEGYLLESQTELLKLSDEYDSLNYRYLHLNIKITLGDWDSLISFIINEKSKKDKRTAQELIETAQLSNFLNSSYTKELIKAAVDKSNDDANILLSAYILAVNAGWEDNEAISKWLNKAVEISGNNGPVQKKSFRDILNIEQNLKRQEVQVWELLNNGDIMTFIAADYLNKSLIHMMIYPALINSLKNDVRRRSIIPAFSGKRKPTLVKTGDIIGMDVTVLLTLSFLNILDKTFEPFETVFIPHSTMSWLFDEKQKITFHQPSLIKKASQIQYFLSTGILEELICNILPDSELVSQIGDELALLITKAKSEVSDNIQRIVVRSSPVYRISSFMEEEADLTKYADILSSCQAVIDKLIEKGQITNEEQKKAYAYLNLSEKPWVKQPEINDGAILYFDDLALDYFIHLGILEKIKMAGFKLFISSKKTKEVNELISYKETSDKIKNLIENIRFVVFSKIKTGKIKVGKKYNVEQLDRQKHLISAHTTSELLALANNCQKIIIDDRYFNQNECIINNSGSQVSIGSTLDLLEALVIDGSITEENKLEYRTKLRQAGYCFIPISDDELKCCINKSIIKKDKFIEIAELKAIRENILLVRMSDFLQLPKELLWLNTLLVTFNNVLKILWLNETDFSRVRILSNWIIDQTNVCGWAHSFEEAVRDNIIKNGYVEYLFFLLLPPADTSQKTKCEYISWSEDNILVPIKEQYPDLFYLLVEKYKNLILNLFNTKDEVSHNLDIRSKIVLEFLNDIPQLIKTSLLNDLNFLKEYNLEIKSIISLGNFDISFESLKFFNSVITALSGAAVEKDLLDENNQEWKLTNIINEKDSPYLLLSRDNYRIRLPELNIFSPDKDIRLCCLNDMSNYVNLPKKVQEKFGNILSERSFKDYEFNSFMNEYHNTPVEQSRIISKEFFKENNFDITSIVPIERSYYERLIGSFDGSISIREYAVNISRDFFEQLSIWSPLEGFLFSLLLSSHADLTSRVNVDILSSEDLIGAFEYLDKYGDITSQLGAIEVGLRIISSRPEIETILINLILKFLCDDLEKLDNNFKLISALFIFTDRELSRTKLFKSEPPFYRRLAAFSHAALIQRQIVKNKGIEIDSFCKWIFDNCVNQFCLQSYIDMRTEPCWIPDYVDFLQIKANFLNRILIAINNNKENINNNSKLYTLVINVPSSNLQLLDKTYMYLPGLLDGNKDFLTKLPIEIYEIIKTQLETDEVEASSFIAIINSAQFFHISDEHVELATKILKCANYRIANLENDFQLINILYGLAKVSAVTKSHKLADELRIVVRKYMNDTQYNLSMSVVIIICLVAASSRENINDWRDYVGDWITELAFGDLKNEDGNILYYYIQMLCKIIPELWITCGRAEAALISL